MRKVILGRTDEFVSAISLGTWAFGGENMSGKFAVGWAGQNDNDSKSVLLKAWESGINHWDTADVYGEGKSEKIIGESWETIPRDDIFLATKVGWDKGSASNWYAPDQMVKNMNRSLSNLKVNHVDLIYLHHCNFGENGEYFDEAMEVLKKFKEQGKARFVGLSDWSNKKIMQYIEDCDPDVVQLYRNVMDDKYESSGLKSYVDENNIGVCFFSPIKHGLLTGKYNKPASFSAGDHRSGVKQFADESIIKKMKKNKSLLERKYKNKKYPVMHGIVNALFNDSPTGCVILGQRNIKQVRIASSLGGILPQEESDWIKALY
tara:strand:- start:393 stop:1349 length:957 start_codon:yes stop_codon:yes gene_type:complete